MIRKITLLMLAFLLALLFSQMLNIGVLSAQSIRLPFAPRYKYTPETNKFAEEPYTVSQACVPGHKEHSYNAYYAVDFAGFTTGTPIYAPVSGDVIFAQYGSGYGLLLKIREDGYPSVDREHWLGHLSKFYVTNGHVDKGDLVALSGETGIGPSHLHYHVQKANGTQQADAIDVRSELPDIVWDDTSDFCDEVDRAHDGSAYPSPIPTGVSANNCAEFYNLGFQGVWGFDAPNCQGNIIFGPLYPGDYNLASMGVNDRLRSISTKPGLNFWINAHNDSDLLKHCHEIDMWNLDTDNYNFSDVMIGWQPKQEKVDVMPGDGVELVSSGWNMASRLVVTNEACPQDQGTRVTASEVSYGFGVGGGSIDSIVPPWLYEFSKAEKTPFEVEIHTSVNATAGVYDAHRVLVGGNVLFETSANEYYYNWNTYGWPDGYQSLRVEYRRLSDGGTWANALVYEEEYYLSPHRNGAALCDGGDGAYLRSGGDCIRLTESRKDLFVLGWGDRSDLTVSVQGPFEAWIFDGVNYEGITRVVKSGDDKLVGGNVSSIRLDPASSTSPPLPTSPFTCDADTVSLYHFDENTGNTVYDECGRVNGTKDNAVSWVTGKFISALKFQNPPDGRGVSLGAPPEFNLCPMSVEMWLRRIGDGRIAGQLGGGGNTGQNKWLLKMQGGTPWLEIWSGGGSQQNPSYKSISDSDWHLLMFSYDCDNTGKLYLDNELVGTVTTVGVWPSGNTTLEIGTAEGIGRFQGEIDEVRISNSVRVPQPPPPPIADFSATTITGTAPLLVDFNDLSIGNITSWYWDFGDGSTSNLKNPQHYFNLSGDYSVRLTVTGPGGSDTASKINLIHVSAQSAPSKSGDANGDGKVDGVDYVIWLNHYGLSTNNGAADGDFNNDRKVDGVDYVIWLNNYGV